jgi:calcineurin-like phosphoesterase family protein
MKFISNSSTKTAGNFINQFRYFASIILLMISILFLPGAGKLAGNSEVALAASDPVIAAAGDIACDPANSVFNSGNGNSNACRQKYTSDLLMNAALAAVLPLGDVQYYCGGYQAFLQSYDLSWGRVKSITHPVVGNHEYLTSGGTDCTSANAGATGYFNYFGAAAGNQGKGYYSYDIGAWHLIALNSNCGDAGGCSPSSPQGQWLEADLNTHSNFCTLAYWHIPLFSSGGRAANNTKDIWQILYNHNADLILNGHDHIYERFAPQAPNAVPDTIRGLRELIVGTGGSDHTNIPGAIAANSEVRNTDTYGILKLTLHPTSYDWQFVPEAGKTFTDSGTGACHGSSPDTIPPTAPSNLTASAVAWNRVSLNWTAGTDNVGVVGYQIFRNGTQIASSSSTAYVDTTVQAQTIYNYSVKTVDGVGLTSNFSNTATVTTPDPASILTFAPIADTYVQLDTPTTNYGSSTQFVVDNSPIRNTFMKFNVSGVGTRTVLSAKLRLYCVDASSVGGLLYRVADTTWDEGTVNWNTAPASDTSSLAALGAVVAGNWYEVDVTSLVNKDGTFSLKMSSTSSDGAYYSAKEGTAGFAPQLVVTTTGPTPTPTFTPTATNTSTPTATSTSQGPILFSDGFESGNLSQWTSGQGLGVQNQKVANGSFAARGTSAAGGATYARKLLVAPQTDLYYRILFNVISQGANTVNLMKFRTAADTAILSVSINNLGNLSYRNDLAGTSVNSTVSVSPGSWQTLQVHVRIADTASQIEVWYNNTLVSILSRTDALGTNPIGVLQLGENTPALTYDIAFDDVVASLSSIGGVAPTNTPTNTPTSTSAPTSTLTNTVIPTNTMTPTNTVTSNILTFTPTADTYVQSDTPTTNYGSANQFVTDNSPIRNMLLKFAVLGIGNKSVISAKLRLYCVDGSPFGGEFHRVADTTWNEGGVNWNTAPVADTGILASLGRVSANNWYEVDITSLVNGDGTYSLKMNSTNSDGAYYSSKEGLTGFAPQLIITTGLAPTSTPTNTPFNTLTFTPSPTATDTPTLTPTPTDMFIPLDTPTPTPTQ